MWPSEYLKQFEQSDVSVMKWVNDYVASLEVSVLTSANKIRNQISQRLVKKLIIQKFACISVADFSLVVEKKISNWNHHHKSTAIQMSRFLICLKQ